MPRKYKRKSNRNGWSEESMMLAISAVGDGMPVLQAATSYEVPRRTLRDKLNLLNIQKSNEKPAPKVRVKMGSKVPVFTVEQEQEITQHLLELERRFYGITRKDVRGLAYELAEKNNINHPFNHAKKRAGGDWLDGFLDRNPGVSFRKPEATSLARARAFNKATVSKFFDLLKEVMDKTHFRASNIWNADETAVTTVPPKKKKIAAAKGKKQVGSISSAERGESCTATMCMSAAGNHLPPFLIFPRERLHEHWKQGAPEGAELFVSKSGYMTIEIFNKWFDHFLNHVRPSQASPALLIIDGHSSHTKNLAFAEKARANHTTVVVLPPHCSHRLQPLDVAFMSPFKAYYSDATETLMRLRPAQVITIKDIAKLVGDAFRRAATTEIAISGFKATGIVPFNRDIFKDDMYAPAAVTDQPLKSPENDPENAGDVDVSNGTEANRIDENAPEPTTSTENDPVNAQDGLPPTELTSPVRKEPEHMNAFTISPKDIIPLPKSEVPQKTKRKRAAQKAATITSDEYTESLKKTKASKSIKEIVKARKPRTKRPKPTKISPAELDTLCDTCGSMFSDSNDGMDWMTCCKCGRWFHETCFKENQLECGFC